jgi:hypothetical protein
MMRTFLAAIPALFAVVAPAQVAFQTAGNDHVTVNVGGRLFSVFYFGEAYPKPFLAPLRTASGLIVTRHYPMERVPGESTDHPHHRGLWIGYGEIDTPDAPSGINFWENEVFQTNRNPKNPLVRGTIVLQRLQTVQPGQRSGTIQAAFAWRGPSGDILREDRTLIFYNSHDLRKLDIDSTLTALREAKFADTKEGFFAIRVADSMTGKHGGVIRNSSGAEGEDNVWGKRADWCTYEGSVDGRLVGIAIFDNPANYNHPPRWHARAYGLFAVNPFGEKSFDRRSSATGGYDLKPGASLHFRYRVIVYSGHKPGGTIAQWYNDYTAGK